MSVGVEFGNTAETASLLPVYRRAAPVFVAGRGCRLIAEDGSEYLDLTAGIGVNALGHGDATIAGALHDAIDAGIVHTSNLFRTRPGELLADALVQASFADHVFFCNSGAEANEAAIKFARRLARAHGGEAKHEIVALKGAFHGRLYGSLAITDRPAFRAPFEPVMPGARFMAHDANAAREAISCERTAAIFVEPVQGEGGVHPIPAELLRDLRVLADENDALLVFDEIQCGLGRTGHAFAYQATGIAPDILTLAKPLAGGLPMGAVLVTARVAAALQPGDHATTFGGGPLVAGVALAVFRRVTDPALLANVRARGEQIRVTAASWSAAGRVTQVRGTGLMWGIELAESAAPVLERARDAGVLVLTAGEKVIRLLPPLVIGEQDLAEGLAVLGEAIG
ncbi:MAG: acetylornithine/succinylornithine family transaminase [Gemmatimonadetes bacterium]|nr:acetylornithine/succinylornithine family transaminase [Gemmatimonadota bacterium]